MIDAILDEHERVVATSRDALRGSLARAIELLDATVRRGRKILVCGNGGSAASAQHFAAECVVRFERERHPLPAIALAADVAALTAIGNDYGYEHAFARQVAAHGRAGDVLIALSTSGRSVNVIRAARTAREMGIAVIALTGKGGGPLGDYADLLVPVESDATARVQEVHDICLHILAAALDRVDVTPASEVTR
jgi:D-sedoheptulose 7-phosphate isomerase